MAGPTKLVTPAFRSMFETDGYFTLIDFFRPDEVRELRSSIDELAARHEEKLRVWGRQGISRAGEISFAAHLSREAALVMEYCRHPRLQQLMGELIGPDVRLYWDQSVYKQPETQREFPWHQDNGYTPVVPAQYITCWLALSDATLENGCIWVLPGSHQGGPREHRSTPLGQVGYDGPEPGVPVPLRAGSMAVFSSLLLHRSGPNLSQDVRRAYVMQYIPADAHNARTGEPFTDRPLVLQGGGRVISG